MAPPPSQSASVPVCSTVLVPSPSRPAQKLAKVSAPVQATAGSVQDAAPLVTVPGRPADAYPAQFWLVTAGACAANPGASRLVAEDLDDADPAGPGIIG